MSPFGGRADIQIKGVTSAPMRFDTVLRARMKSIAERLLHPELRDNIMRKLHCLMTVVFALAFAEMAFSQGVSINKPGACHRQQLCSRRDRSLLRTNGEAGWPWPFTPRQMVPIDKQDVVRMNHDTLYSSGVFDLKASPLTIILPDAGKRFMSMQVIRRIITRLRLCTPRASRYTEDIVGRAMLSDHPHFCRSPNPDDITVANTLQDAIKVEQPSVGKFEVPNWNPVSQKKIRDALSVLEPCWETCRVPCSVARAKSIRLAI